MQSILGIVQESSAVFYRWRCAPGWSVEFISNGIRQWGYEPAELVSGKITWVNLVYPGDLPLLTTQIESVMQGGPLEFKLEYRLLTARLDIRWVENRCRAVLNAQGQVTHVEGMLIDVTERKEFEQMGETHMRRLRLLIQNTPHCSFFQMAERGDGKYYFPYFSDHILSMTGISAKEVMASPELLHDLILHEDLPRLLIERVRSRSSMMAFDCEFRFRHRDGAVRWMRFQAAPRQRVQFPGQIIWEGVALDITEHRMAVYERERLIEELRDALANVKTLSGMIPICSMCKSIRNDRGFWRKIEAYIQEHSDAVFSHSICPDCMHKLYPEDAEAILKTKEPLSPPPAR